MIPSKTDVKVGLFVLLGLALSGLVVFLIGEERGTFERKLELQARFADVQGLKRGAPVSMGGVNVGRVASVTHPEDAADASVHVRIDVGRRFARRILSDSTVKIVPKGLLGDKAVLITRGTKGRQLEDGDLIPSEEPGDLFRRIDAMAGKAELTMTDVSSAAQSLSDERLHRDLRESVAGLNVLLKEVTRGEGYPRRFLTDKVEAERISRTIDNLDRSATELTATLREVRLAARQLRTGPGFAHDVLYGPGPKKEIAQLGQAADEVALTLRGIREGDGFAHDVLFGGDGEAKDALGNVTTLTADLRDIVRNVKQGKGTIGALLVDPSIYEDMKRILGNVERNRVLRALVRYSIKQDDEPPPVDVGSRP